MTRFVDFTDPPVVETVLSVAFAPIEGFTSAHAGAFWALVEDDFASVAERPRYEMPVERIGGPPQAGGVELRFGPAPANSRIWLISGDDQRLIQIQRDWFAYNWRKRQSQYVHYDEGRAHFETYFSAFERYLTEQELGIMEPTQCEVTYINHIPVVGNGHGAVDELLSFASRPNLAAPGVSVESAQMSYVISLTNDAGPFGRLHVSVQPSMDGEEAVWVMNMTARGLPSERSLEGVLSFFDAGREAIVQNFKLLTTESMHKRWGIK